MKRKNRERDETMAKIEGNLIARAVLKAFKKSWNNPVEREIIEARMKRKSIENQTISLEEADKP